MRSVKPGVYNARRLNETPIPDINQNNTNNDCGDSDETNWDESSGSGEKEGDRSDDGNSEVNDELVIQNPSENGESAGRSDDENSKVNDEPVLQNSSENGESVEPNRNESNVSSDVNLNHPNDSTEACEAVKSADIGPSLASNSNHNSEKNDIGDIKPVLHSMNRADLIEINAILNENDDSSDDEILFFGVDGSFPLPVQYSVDGMIKHEDDEISGNLDFEPKVSSIVFLFFANCTHLIQKRLHRKMATVCTKWVGRYSKSREIFLIKYANGVLHHMMRAPV